MPTAFGVVDVLTRTGGPVSLHPSEVVTCGNTPVHPFIAIADPEHPYISLSIIKYTYSIKLSLSVRHDSGTSGPVTCGDEALRLQV